MANRVMHQLSLKDLKQTSPLVIKPGVIAHLFVINELAMLINHIIPMGRLITMTQFLWHLLLD